MERKINSIVSFNISDIQKLISEKNTLAVHVKPNSDNTRITSIDKGIIFVDLNAKPVDNKANIEIIKYFSKLLKKKIKIKTGLKSRDKILSIE